MLFTKKYLTISHSLVAQALSLVMKALVQFIGIWYRKLLLAVQECFFEAVASDAEQSVTGQLKAHYYEIKAGIGLYKNPALYGASQQMPIRIPLAMQELSNPVLPDRSKKISSPG